MSRLGVSFFKSCLALRNSFNWSCRSCPQRHVWGRYSSCCGRSCASLSQKWKWLLRDPGRAPDYSSCSNKASASELRLIQGSWYTLAALWWPGWGDRGQGHEDHTHWPPSVCSALEVPVLYPVHVGPEGPPECPPPLPGGNLTARVAPSGRGELCQSCVVYVSVPASCFHIRFVSYPC